MSKVSKEEAQYIVSPHDTSYECKDCEYYDAHAQACAKVEGAIKPNGGCVLWEWGPGEGEGAPAKVSRKAAVYEENPYRKGFSCARCVHMRLDCSCEIVDGKISPHGCCDLWQRSPQRLGMTRAALDKLYGVKGDG